MKRALLLFIACLLSAVLAGQSSAAGTYKILKPTVFTRSAGKPVEQTRDFLSPVTDSKARLIISNGDTTGNHRVSSATVMLNGRQVAGPSDFNNKIARLEKVVSVALANTLSVQIAGTPGDFLSISVDGTSPLPVINITNPLDQSQTDKPFALVKGEVVNTSGEFGVVVNGIPAQMTGNAFFANNVSLSEGANTITAVVTQADGARAESSITITADTAGREWLKLSLNPETGMAAPAANPPQPFTATLRVNPHLADNSANRVWDLLYVYSGPGSSQVQMTLDSSSDDGLEHQLSFNDPGVYTLFFAIATDNDQVYTNEITVNVLDRGALDKMLGAKWENVKTAWAAQDVEGGLANFAESSKANYRGALNAIIAELPQIVSNMQDMELIYARGRYVKYRINRLQDINGTMVDMTYYLYFVKDQSGLWKVDQF